MNRAKLLAGLPDPLLILINYYGFLSIPAAILIVVAVLLAIGGYTPPKWLMLAAVVVISALIWLISHARQSRNVPSNSAALLDDITQSGKYAMLAFESEFCLSSTNVGKQLIELEQTYPDHFKIYSISILQEPGKELFKQFNGRVTPTYVLLDAEGKVLIDYPLVLPVERVQYAVKQRSSQV